MAGLEWKDVVIIGAVATVGFTLLSYWYSGIMAKRNWSYQVKAKPKKKAEKVDAQPDAAGAAPKQ